MSDATLDPGQNEHVVRLRVAAESALLSEDDAAVAQDEGVATGGGDRSRKLDAAGVAVGRVDPARGIEPLDVPGGEIVRDDGHASAGLDAGRDARDGRVEAGERAWRDGDAG